MQRKFDGRLARIRVDDMRHSTDEWRGPWKHVPAAARIGELPCNSRMGYMQHCDPMGDTPWPVHPPVRSA